MTPDQLADLHAAAFTESRPWGADEFARLLENPHVFCVSVDHSFALGRVVADESELLTLATDPMYRRRGFGKLALERYDSQAVALGAKTSFLEVSAENSSAVALYTASGYQVTAERANYYQLTDGRRAKALIMNKNLPFGQII